MTDDNTWRTSINEVLTRSWLVCAVTPLGGIGGGMGGHGGGWGLGGGLGGWGGGLGGGSCHTAAVFREHRTKKVLC